MLYIFATVVIALSLTMSPFFSANFCTADNFLFALVRQTTLLPFSVQFRFLVRRLACYRFRCDSVVSTLSLSLSLPTDSFTRAAEAVCGRRYTTVSHNSRFDRVDLLMMVVAFVCRRKTVVVVAVRRPFQWALATPVKNE